MPVSVEQLQFSCQMEMKIFQTPQESSLTLSYKFSIHLPYNPTFPLPGIHPRDIKHVYTFFFLRIIIEDLFIIIPNGQSRVQNSLLDSVGEGEGGMFQENSIETCILSRVKQITSPGWVHETSAQTWCTGKTQRDRVEREVGGGIGMGNTCKPMAVSFQCMTKPTKKKKKKPNGK